MGLKYSITCAIKCNYNFNEDDLADLINNKDNRNKYNVVQTGY